MELSWTAIGAAAGGLGLLLLGMGLLTDGLKRAAGQALHRLLGTWTRTRARGLVAGALITTLVQSSSAVTVAIIGFANAGLLTLGQAAWVVFGSNVGTTMTGWLVALVGLRMNVEALALPLVGLGMLLRLVRPASRWGGLGEALAGLGVLFVGLDLLKDTFTDFGSVLDVGVIESWGVLGYVAGVGLGALITMLMQSSSAAMAIVLTARAQGALSPAFAGALVIGANVGTTSTALLSTIGATSNARRVALLHVVFNLGTGLVALLLLVPILAGIEALHVAFDAAPTPAADLALFHTTFNVLGVALMWPVSAALVRFLERRFRSAEEDAARPRHLDTNVLPVPELAARALLLEMRRAASVVLALARAVATREIEGAESFAARARPARRLLVAIAEYVTQLNRTLLPTNVAGAVTNVLRAHEHIWTMVRISGDLAGLHADTDEALPRERVPLSADYVAHVVAALDAAGTDGPDFDLGRLRALHDRHEEARDAEHGRLVALSSRPGASLPATNQALQELAHDRRLVSRAWKLAAALHVVQGTLDAGNSPPPIEEHHEPDERGLVQGGAVPAARGAGEAPEARDRGGREGAPPPGGP